MLRVGNHFLSPQSPCFRPEDEKMLEAITAIQRPRCLRRFLPPLSKRVKNFFFFFNSQNETQNTIPAIDFTTHTLNLNILICFLFFKNK
jgi:hypothetical protein